MSGYKVLFIFIALLQWARLGVIVNKMTVYRIPLGNSKSGDLEGAKTLFENNEKMFENTLLSKYAEDYRYFMLHETFTVLSVTHDMIEYTCKLNFYAGCTDQNETFDEHASVRYRIEDDHIVFELDETVWYPQ
ncbi:hypothetical protein LU631_08450 [Erwinia tracheiphila]|uniref:Uncharacterized protein n=1 Tax=Erwinia tracheiphila TaxID=65700 RepID=A0A0M2KB30_9GAMM|nr:hypothetical protein [Erwinia tracheiphila]AXF74959.1 hypothetical protein AV903_00720 [Erwinia tracheiphila]EOS94326.1 hypothetical protein ETR_14371 [Erwinia tracheiphila PSU-1]KKF34226.1 hypothetical protein SY86_24850 [Erwinia tracheiphila]UIA82496.1 hypothetical protein LU604_18480 [Erwinia tracheiphila]UIA89252.1 hypothetical protein LU631_08450 [Erwinia tracheiphila]